MGYKKYYGSGQGVIGVLITIIIITLIGGSVYYYFSKQTPEIPKISQRTEEAKKQEVPPSREELKQPQTSQCASLPQEGSHIVTEPIVFALNESFAAKIPSWKERADSVIEKVNFVYGKNTFKRFSIARYLTYPDAEYTNIFTNPDRYPEFYQNFGNRGGITYMLLIFDEGISNQQIKERYGSDKINLAMQVNKDGKQYHFLLQGSSANTHPLLPNPHPATIYMPIHEFGHFQGIAVPDWYLYKYSDATGVEPKFSDYALSEDPFFRNDPMAVENYTDKDKLEDLNFNELSKSIINRNLDRQYTWTDIQRDWVAKTSKVKVVSKNGTPVVGATVKVYGAKKACWFCSTITPEVRWGLGVPNNKPPLQTLTTDANGFAVYESPSSNWDFNEREATPYLAKAIKAYFGGKSATKVVNFIDLQRACVLDVKDEYIVTITLN